MFNAYSVLISIFAKSRSVRDLCTWLRGTLSAKASRKSTIVARDPRPMLGGVVLSATRIKAAPLFRSSTYSRFLLPPTLSGRRSIWMASWSSIWFGLRFVADGLSIICVCFAACSGALSFRLRAPT